MLVISKNITTSRPGKNAGLSLTSSNLCRGAQLCAPTLQIYLDRPLHNVSTHCFLWASEAKGVIGHKNKASAPYLLLSAFPVDAKEPGLNKYENDTMEPYNQQMEEQQ